MVLQRYLTHLILAYARAYIGNIEANLHLSLWGGDVVLNNLELRLDVLQRALAVPAHFAFQRGRIKQMRIHIPWTALTYKPVEVTLTDVDCVLTAHARADESGGPAAAAAASAVSASAATPVAPSPPSAPPPQLEAEEAAEVGGSGWAADLIAKIVANLTVRIEGLSFSFIQDGQTAKHDSGNTPPAQTGSLHPSASHDTSAAASSSSSAATPPQILLSLRVAHALLQSTNAKHAVQFVELEGPWKLIHKSFDIQHVSIHLGHMLQQQTTTAAAAAAVSSAHSAQTAAAAKASGNGSSPHRGCAQQLTDDDAILRDMSLTVRIRTYLAALGGSSLIRLPYREEQPPPLSGAAMSVEVHMQQAAQFYVSDRQLQLLSRVLETVADRSGGNGHSAGSARGAAASPRASHSSPSQTADSLSLAYLHQHMRSSSPVGAGAAAGVLHPSLAQQHNSAATAALAVPSPSSPARSRAGSISRARSSSLPSASPQQSRGWRSWMWALVGEEDGQSPRSNPAAEFYLAFGHLAPKEQLVFAAHVPAIELHLLHTVQRPTRHGLFEQHHLKHRQRAARWANKDPARSRPAHGSRVTVASVRLHDVDVSASQQLLLPSPMGQIVADEEEQRLATSRTKRALNLRMRVTTPKVTAEIFDIHSDSVLRLQLDDIAFAHERASRALSSAHSHSRSTSPPSSSSSSSGRSASTADESHAEAMAALTHSTVVEGSFLIQAVRLAHTHMEREHPLWNWRSASSVSASASDSSVSSSSVAAAAKASLPVTCKWNAREMDVEICGFDLYVPLVSAHLVMQALTFMQPASSGTSAADSAEAPFPAAAVAPVPLPRPIRPYRANAQSMKLVVHSGRIGVGSSLDGHGSTLAASVQWQSVFVLQSPTQCDPMWQHVVLSDALEVRLVDLSCAVGKHVPRAPSAHLERVLSSSSNVGDATPKPLSPESAPIGGFFPSSQCLSPVTCVVQQVERTTVETMDPAIAAHFLSLPVLLAALPRPSFTPLYRAAHVDVQVQELRAQLELEQLAILIALGQVFTHMSPRSPLVRGDCGSGKTRPPRPSVGSFPAYHPYSPTVLPAHITGVSADDFRCMKLLEADSSQRIRPRAGHLTLLDQSGQRCLMWRYPSPRGVVQLNFRPVRPAASPALPQYVFGALSAWDPVSLVFVPVCDVLVDVFGVQRAPLALPHIVAEEWMFTVSEPTEAQVRDWARSSKNGKHNRWAQLLSRQGQSSSPRPLPSARELARSMRVESALYCQHGRNLHVRMSIPHAQLTLTDRINADASPVSLAVLHVQRVQMRSQLLLRHPLDPSGCSPRVGSSTALKIAADGVWLDLHQSRDLTLHPLLRPVRLAALLRHNDLVPAAVPDAAGTSVQLSSFLPAALWDRRERGWAVSLKSGAARLNLGSKVFLSAKLISQRMQLLQQRMAAIANEAEPMTPTTSSPTVVHASSAYVLTNRSGIALRYGQVGTRESVSLPVEAVHSYSWSSLSPSFAHPLHAPPEVPNAFEAPAEPWAAPPECDDRLRYHWMRVSTAEVHAWSRPFMIDVPASSGSQVDFSSLQHLGKLAAAAGSTDGSITAAAPLRHVFLYRMVEEQVSSRHTTLSPAAATAVSRHERSLSGASTPSVHVCILFVSVERRGLNTFVTFLPSHIVINQLPFALAAHSDTESDASDVHDAFAAMQRGSAGAALSGFGVEGRHVDLTAHAAFPLPMWYPCTASPLGAKFQRLFRLFLRPRHDADLASFLHRADSNGFSAPALSRLLSPQHSTSSSDSGDQWEWREVLSLQLDSLSSFLVPGLVSPPPLTSSRSGTAAGSGLAHQSVRLCAVKHKQDAGRSIYFWAQISSAQTGISAPILPSPALAFAAGGGRVLPSVLHPWRITLCPAFVFHNPMSCTLLLRLAAAAAATAPGSTLLAAREAAGCALRLDPGQTRAVFEVDPTAGESMELSVVVPEQEQSRSTSECRPLASSLLTLTARAGLPASSVGLATSGGQSVLSASLYGAGSAADPMHDRPQLHMVLSDAAHADACASDTLRPSIGGSGGGAPATLCVSFVAPFTVHNLCADAMWVRTADLSAPILVQPQTAAGVDYLQWSVDDIATLSIGVHADPTEPASLVYWSDPFSTTAPTPRHGSAGSRRRRSLPQLDVELDILAVANVEPPGSRPIVMLHQFVVSISKERAAAGRGASGGKRGKDATCSAASNGEPCGLPSCACCGGDTVLVTHLWLKPRFFVHNRTGLPLYMRQLGVLSSSPIPGPPMLGAGEARALEAWNVSCASRPYEASLAREFAPLVSLSLPSSEMSVDELPPNTDADTQEQGEEEWSWSSDLRLLDATAQASVSLYNCRLGFQRLLSYVVLHHRRVRHVVVFHDAQAQCVLLNRMEWPIEWRERNTLFQRRTGRNADSDVDVDGGRVNVLAPEQCTEFQLAASRVANQAQTPGQRRASQGEEGTGANGGPSDESPAEADSDSVDDSDPSSLESQLAALTSQQDSGWEGEERAFDQRVALSQLVFRMAGSVHEEYPWSTALALRPGEYSVLLPAASPALPPVPARIAVAMRNGSILIVLDALEGRCELTSAPAALLPQTASSRSLDVDVEIAELSVAMHDDSYVAARSTFAQSSSAGADDAADSRDEARRKDSFSSPSSSSRSAGATPKAPRSIGTGALDAAGELLLLLTLDRVHLRTQLTTVQPRDHYAPFAAETRNAAATGKAADAAPLRPTPLSPSVLPQLYTVIDAQIGAVQLDNQLEAELPVVLCSFQADPHAVVPALQLSFVCSSLARLDESAQGDHAPLLSSSSLLQRSDIHIASARLAPLCINVEDQLAFRLIGVGLAFARDMKFDFARAEQHPFAELAAATAVRSSSSTLVRALSSSVAAASIQSERERLSQSMHLTDEFLAHMDKIGRARLFLHYLFVSDLDLRVTVRAGAGVPMFLGAEQMPVSLSSVSLRCVLCPPERLLRELVAGYTASAIARSPLLLGSLDLLGNPTFWLHSVGAGVRDLLLLPRNALGQGPRAFVGAIGGGLLSLLRHTTEGTLTSVSGFSSSLARNMERLSGSEGSYSARRQGRRPASVGGGLVSGVKSLGQGVVGGLVGVVAQPLAGASAGGVGGFFRGVGSGLVGAVSRPLGGVCDLVAATSQGLARTSGVDSMPYTQRFVRRTEIDAQPADAVAAVASADTLHHYHHFSAPKLTRMAELLGESYVDHAVVAFARQATPASSSTADAVSSTTATSAASTSPPALRVDDFALLLVTDAGLRLAHDDRVIQSFRWDEVEFSHRRSAVAPLIPSTHPASHQPMELAAAFLDERARLEWLRSAPVLGGPSSSSSVGVDQGGAPDDDDEENLTALQFLHLPSLILDVLVLRPLDGAPSLHLWLPRIRRAALIGSCFQAKDQFNKQARILRAIATA